MDVEKRSFEKIIENERGRLSQMLASYRSWVREAVIRCRILSKN